MLLENDLALLSLRAVQLRLVAVADGCGDGVGLQRKCGSVVLCVRSSAITLALHGGLPCLGSGESERRMTDRESASLSRKARSVVCGPSFLTTQSKRQNFKPKS